MISKSELIERQAKNLLELKTRFTGLAIAKNKVKQLHDCTSKTQVKRLVNKMNLK